MCTWIVKIEREEHKEGATGRTERERERDITDEYSSITYDTLNRVWLDD